MPTIRDLVAAIRQRDGVEAAIVLGRDGLLIDGQAVPNLDAEGAGRARPVHRHRRRRFGAVSQRGQLVTGVFEHPNGLVVVSVLSPEAVLLVLVQPQANVGQLLFELRRNREHIAALV